MPKCDNCKQKITKKGYCNECLRRCAVRIKMGWTNASHIWNMHFNEFLSPDYYNQAVEYLNNNPEEFKNVG